MVNHNAMWRLFTAGLIDYPNKSAKFSTMLFGFALFGFYLSRQFVNPGLRCDLNAAIFVASKMAAAIVKSTVDTLECDYTFECD